MEFWIFRFYFKHKDILQVNQMRKPTICTCENKDADQLCSKYTADQRLCFHHTDSTIPLLLISKVSSYAVTVQPGLCWTWSETHIVVCFFFAGH